MDCQCIFKGKDFYFGYSVVLVCFELKDEFCCFRMEQGFVYDMYIECCLMLVGIELLLCEKLLYSCWMEMFVEVVWQDVILVLWL